MGKKKCFVVGNRIEGSRWNLKKEKWITIIERKYSVRDGERWNPEQKVFVSDYVSVGNVPPQLRKMWKLALKGLRGKAAIAEVEFETWIPYITKDCIYCNGIGAHHDPNGYSCKECKATGKVRRLMTPDDLKK